MNDTIKKTSTALSWLLRHGANEAGLTMDSAGFAAVDDVLRKARLTRPQLEEVVANNNKDRFELVVDDGAGRERIRAVQGHSLSGTPVTREGLESSWEAVSPLPPRTFFHGTSVSSAETILAGDGVVAMARTHVHLAESETAVTGKRAGVAVLLVVSSTALRDVGVQLFRAPNGVLLARAVPVSAIVDVAGQTKAGRAAEGALRAQLALATS